jgi:hypothetical protein
VEPEGRGASAELVMPLVPSPLVPCPACGVGLLLDVSADAAVAMTTTSTTAAATTAMETPGPASCGITRRSHRGRRFDSLALWTRDCSRLTRAFAAPDPVAEPGETLEPRGDLPARSTTDPGWHAYGLNLLLYELAEPDTLARGMDEAIRMDNPPREPVMVYADEAGIWLPKLTKAPVKA